MGREAVLNLARAGRVADAWKAWEDLPPTTDQRRLGIELAVLSGQLSRGMEVYDSLTKQTGQPDRPALTALALAVADPLAEATDLEARAEACAAALMLNDAHVACRRSLAAMSQSRDIDEQAWAVYALANAGVRSTAPTTSGFAAVVSKPVRFRFAQRMTRLSGAERLALLQPLLDDPDVGTRYQAILVAAEIPGPEVTNALAALESGSLPPPLSTALMLARATHGDRSRLKTIAESIADLSGYEKVTAGRILLAANDPRGSALLNELMKSSVDIERLQAAGALVEANSKPARRIVLDIVNSGSAAIRPAALITAGKAGLGTEPEVYRRLTDASPAVRAAAIEAIATTFSAAPHSGAPPRVQ
jgi:hypothetical protein